MLRQRPNKETRLNIGEQHYHIASAVLTRRSFPNTGIRKILPRLGLAAVNNPAG